MLGRVVGARVPVLLVAADKRIPAYRHPPPGRTEIRNRVMVVLVIERWGLHVAITRFREFDEPSSDVAERTAAVAEIQAAMVTATRSGARFGDVLDAGRAAYASFGFPDEWREHHQGGSIGYQARERIATPKDWAVIRSGMAFAWNPTIAGAKAEATCRRLPSATSSTARAGTEPPPQQARRQSQLDKIDLVLNNLGSEGTRPTSHPIQSLKEVFSHPAAFRLILRITYTTRGWGLSPPGPTLVS